VAGARTFRWSDVTQTDGAGSGGGTVFDDRWTRLWHALFYLTLGVPTLLVVADGAVPTRERLTALAVATALVVWYRLVIVAHPERYERLGPMALHLVVMTAAYCVLVSIDTRYFFLLYSLFSQVFMLLPGRWAYAGAAGVGFLAAWTSGELDRVTTDPAVALAVLGNIGLAVAVGMFVRGLSNQSDQRRRMIGELERTRAELSTALAENAWLLAAARADADAQAALHRAGAALSAAATADGIAAAVGEHLTPDGPAWVALLAGDGPGMTQVAGWQRAGQPPLPPEALAGLNTPAEPGPLDPAELPAATRTAWAALGAEATVLVPVEGAEEVSALLVAGASLDPRTTMAVWAIAPQVALASENQRLLGQARQTGVLQERQRLAREIHDTLAQGLVGVVTQLEAADEALVSAEPAARRHLGAARETARTHLGEVRRAVHALRPAALEGARLPDALAELTGRLTAETGIRTEASVTGEPCELGSEVEVALLRVAQEALANVRRHARAGRAGLTLSYMEDRVMLDVRDDGIGFDPAASPPGHGEGGFGLVAMAQRLAEVGGTLEVESRPGEGTTVVAAVPVAGAA